jgi:RNA polymerase sigma factor (sigma-70 family)
MPPALPLKREADDDTDHDLVARVRAGDDRAFERLYRRYHRRIGAYIQGMVHDHARAEDVTQDVFMSALRRMRETDRPIAFKPWIYEIAKNACIDQFRRSRRAEEVSMDAEEGLGSADYGKLITRDPSPEVAVENKQSLDHLCGAFGGLSETHHEILVMRELEGLSYREIGERLGMTRPAVESTLFRARRRLTEEYDELVSGERCQRVQSIIATAAQGSLGARDRKRLARHVSYCQPCMRQARISGVDSADLVRTPLRARIAALLPLPAFLKARIGGDEALGRQGDVSTLASWSAQASSLDPSLVSGWGKAAATAATIALAGVGAGVATDPPKVASALGGSMLERLQRDGDGRSASARNASSVSGGSAGTAVATPAGRRVDSAGRAVGAPASAPVSGADFGGAGATRKSDGSGSTSEKAREGGSGTAAPATTTDPQTAAGEATGTAQETAGSDPLGDTLSRLGGGSGGDDAGSGTGSTDGGSASGGGGSSIRLPGVPLPSGGGGQTPPAPSIAGAGQVKSDAVGQAVDGVTSAAGSTVEGATQGTTGILGGQ